MTLISIDLTKLLSNYILAKLQGLVLGGGGGGGGGYQFAVHFDRKEK